MTLQRSFRGNNQKAELNFGMRLYLNYVNLNHYRYIRERDYISASRNLDTTLTHDNESS